MIIERAYVEPNYAQINGEDGFYYAQRGYYVVAYTTDEFGNQVIWTHATDLFLTTKEAEAFISNVVGTDILATAWNCVSVSNPNDLPDYVTNPGRPEYN